jgi:hypothetical protein
VRRIRANSNVLNALVLWGILSPKQLSLLLGVSVSYCSQELKKLVKKGVAKDIGRTNLPPTDPLYGRYYLIKRSSKISRLTTAKSSFRLRVGARSGDKKIVIFSSGLKISRHYLFSSLATFWVVDFVSRLDPSNPAMCFPESYLRSTLGWHRGMNPPKNAANPRLTMVPDSLVVYRRAEIRIEAEITPKSKVAYRSIFEHLRPSDDTVIYVYPDLATRNKISNKLPKNYRVGEVVFGNNEELLSVFKKNVLSLFAR